MGGMGTWEQRSQPSAQHTSVGSAARLMSLLASGLAVVLLASSPSWLLRVQSRATALIPIPALRGQQRVAGSLEVAPSVRSAQKPQMPARQVPVAAKYVVSIARFQDRGAAETQARRVRSKGYVATVVRDGSAYRVVTRTYRDEAAARHTAQVLNEIGFGARVLALRETFPAVKDENSRLMSFA